MSLYKCDKCGEPTDNDQSFTLTTVHGPGRRYEVHRCDRCDKRFQLEIDWESEGETIREDTLICPYCGHEYDTYDAYDFEEGRTPEVECEICGKKFDLEIETMRLYSTKRSACEMPDDYGEEDLDE